MVNDQRCKIEIIESRYRKHKIQII